MTWQDVVDLAQQWPEVIEATSYGEPSLKVRKRLLARHRTADDSIVLLDVPHDERDHLIEILPDVFFREAHYDGYNIVLAKLANAPPETIARLLERRWRGSASKRALSEYDAAH
ncbi:hypothetical protein [Cognatiyoonia sp. IB215182]|uniref:MmcQ/YjbR family DNA-binding protein n=1 Tax=Cognatiyoonia sp. IB215182 TaxID=3097353 RepID=UPI002A1128F9|nr:hypothetical protein [Cognatiyoonia sp. IB215182]MDX8352102.1 hypothetical protein [Cognatiyoonia sp. IB215182]